METSNQQGTGAPMTSDLKLFELFLSPQGPLAGCSGSF